MIPMASSSPKLPGGKCRRIMAYSDPSSSASIAYSCCPSAGTCSSGRTIKSEWMCTNWRCLCKASSKLSGMLPCKRKHPLLAPLPMLLLTPQSNARTGNFDSAVSIRRSTSAIYKLHTCRNNMCPKALTGFQQFDHSFLFQRVCANIVSSLPLNRSVPLRSSTANRNLSAAPQPWLSRSASQTALLCESTPNPDLHFTQYYFPCLSDKSCSPLWHLAHSWVMLHCDPSKHISYISCCFFTQTTNAAHDHSKYLFLQMSHQAHSFSADALHSLFAHSATTASRVSLTWPENPSNIGYIRCKRGPHWLAQAKALLGLT